MSFKTSVEGAFFPALSFFVAESVRDAVFDPSDMTDRGRIIGLVVFVALLYATGYAWNSYKKQSQMEFAVESREILVPATLIYMILSTTFTKSMLRSLSNLLGIPPNSNLRNLVGAGFMYGVSFFALVDDYEMSFVTE